MVHGTKVGMPWPRVAALEQTEPRQVTDRQEKYGRLGRDVQPLGALSRDEADRLVEGLGHTQQDSTAAPRSIHQRADMTTGSRSVPCGLMPGRSRQSRQLLEICRQAKGPRCLIAAYAAILTGDCSIPPSTNPATYRATASFPCCPPSTAILPLYTVRNVATARLKTSEWRTVT